MTTPPPTPSSPDRTPPAPPIAASCRVSRLRGAVADETDGSRTSVRGARSVIGADSSSEWIHLTRLWIQFRLAAHHPALPPDVVLVRTHRLGEHSMRITRVRVVIGAVLLLALAVGVSASARTKATPALKNGGTLTIALDSDPDALDPTLARTFVGRMVFAHMCEKLYDLNAKLQIVPQLAASLPKLSADKKTATIKLRKGVKFNDGTAFNAAAVKKSLDRHKTLPRSTRASEIAPVESVEVVNASTVALHLSERYSPLTAQLADRAGMIMSPKALDDLGDKFATNPVCVGPFMFKDRVAGDHITLEKSPYYYNKKAVHLNTIVFKIIVDPSARAQNLRSHDVDAISALASTELQSVQHDRSL